MTEFEQRKCPFCGEFVKPALSKMQLSGGKYVATLRCPTLDCPFEWHEDFTNEMSEEYRS